MKPNMLELVGEWKQAYSLLCELTYNDSGEIVDDYAGNQELLAVLGSIESNIKNKADGYAEIIRDTLRHEKAISEEAERLAKRAAFFRRRAEWLKARLKQAMESMGLKKIETPYNTITIKTNGGQQGLVLPGNILDLPEEYRQVITEHKARADVIRKALAEGKEVPGCKLQERGSHLLVR